MSACQYQTLFEIFQEFYGMALSLEGDKIRVKASRKIYSDKLREVFAWLAENREHAIERLRMEG